MHLTHVFELTHSALCADIPYQAGMVNDTINNERATITVATYLDGMVSHATMNKMAKIIDTMFVQHMHHQQINTDNQKDSWICDKEGTHVLAVYHAA